jgi:hypothetical protein
MARLVYNPPILAFARRLKHAEASFEKADATAHGCEPFSQKGEIKENYG